MGDEERLARQRKKKREIDENKQRLDIFPYTQILNSSKINRPTTRDLGVVDAFDCCLFFKTKKMF